MLLHIIPPRVIPYLSIDEFDDITDNKILNKPIVTTNYTTVKDQIQHNINGLVVAMEANKIADGIIKMIENKK